MIEEEFIDYDLALKLKEKGFDKDCLACYIPRLKAEHELRGCGAYIFSVDGLSRSENNIIAAPLWQQVSKWLYYEHQIYLNVIFELSTDLRNFEVNIIHIGNDKILERDWYKSPDEALYEGIKKALKFI